ncbi:MAG TPA: hypothetical protein VGH27_32135 [Streptosporangiaceae bacterium]
MGGYHGSWLTGQASYDVPVSRAGLAVEGGTLGAGVVLVPRAGCCPLSEVARVATYLAKESSGQRGPCKLGLPGIARSLTALAEAPAAPRHSTRHAAAPRPSGAAAHARTPMGFTASCCPP